MTIILISLSLVFFLLLKKKSLSLFLVTIQLISLIGTYFLGRSMNVQTMNDIGLIFLMIILIILIILPWKYYHGIRNIVPFDENKLRIITKFLIYINVFIFIIFLTTTIIVQSTIKDINEFKYAEGVSMDFYYNNLPFPTLFFNVAVLVYYFSYFILPLHFYYLYKKKFWLASICFVLSLNIILYGLTFFSRAVVVQYALLYISMIYMFFGMFSQKTKRIIITSVIFFGVISIVYLASVSQRRFNDDKEQSKSYSKTIPSSAITQDPVIYGYLDYTSQGFFNGFEVLQLYNGEGFDGKLTYGSLTSFFLTPMQSYELLKYRQKLWPRHYSYSFNGFVAYAVYDYGIFGSLLFGICFFFVIRSMRPTNNSIKLKHMFLLVLLVQIPLMSIFYNQIGGFFIAILLWIPLYIYIKFNFKK